MKIILFRKLPRLILGRNSIAIMIAFATISLLYFQFQATPAGADPKAALKRHALEQMIPTQMAELTLPTTNSGAGQGAGTLSGASALRVNLLMLEKGHARLSKVPDYTATFFRHERIRGKMGTPQLMQLKMRHAPFSIYLKWLTGADGQEVLYIENENDGKMIVHPGGWKGNLVSSVNLDPSGSKAMQDSRNPITEAGLLKLMEILIDNRKRDLKNDIGSLSTMLDNQVVDDHDCFCFVIEYSDADRKKLPVDNPYRKSVIYIDKELLFPIHIQNYTWLTEEQQHAKNVDEMTLVERYSYKDIQLNTKLVSKDFDHANLEYHFTRR
ncbi:hypothetical protein MNBD_PLANCTO02-1999 [hydrothermal vent metagenome]|uniref:DUF1571 domain-containing protein n=1 Tax=hydrothermal vent metagenome TaxID=652676 RepID=A0A3B1E0G9_9ZZZZ